jgi:predicted acyl esterase
MASEASRPSVMLIDWDVPIEMDDGVVLRADVFRPAEEGQYPVLLSSGPFGKGIAFQEAYPGLWQRLLANDRGVDNGSSNRYQNRGTVDPDRWVPDGYVCVRVDSRGTGRSPGFVDPFSPRETRDLYECIEWAAAQGWSSGRVGLSGVAYFAINQWQVASLQPPHLAAMVPWEGAADWYRDVTHHGGILSTFCDTWYIEQVIKIQHGFGERGRRNPNTGELVSGPETLSEEELVANRCRFGNEILAHPLDDGYHQDRSPEWSKVKVPFLSAGNWGGLGIHLRGNVEAFVRAASEDKWLEIHGLEPWILYHSDYGVDLQKGFFGHFLKGEDNGWPARPRVTLGIRSLDGFKERTGNHWPSETVQWTPLYLDPAHLRLGWGPVASESSVEYDTLSSGVTFVTESLTEDLEITGPIAARLFVSSTTADADVFGVLRLLDPDGEEVVFKGAADPYMPLTQGWLRASHRRLDTAHTTPYRPYHPHDRVEPLVPGEVYRLDVEFWPTSIVVPAGYRIALTLRGRDHEYTGPRVPGYRPAFDNEVRGCGPFVHDDQRDRPAALFDGINLIHAGGEKEAFLLLPVIPAGPAAGAQLGGT